MLLAIVALYVLHVRLLFSLRACNIPSSCTTTLVATTCSVGLCGAGATHFAKYSANTCVECPDSDFVRALIGLAFMTIIVAAMGFMVRKNNHSIAPPTVDDVLAGYKKDSELIIVTLKTATSFFKCSPSLRNWISTGLVHRRPSSPHSLLSLKPHLQRYLRPVCLSPTRHHSFCPSQSSTQCYHS